MRPEVKAEPKTPKPDTVDRSAEVQSVTLRAVVVNISLVTIQLLTGLVTGSQALIADSLHALSDLFSDGLVLYFNRVANAPPDAEHPYGHGRFETLGSFSLAIILIVTGLAISLRAISSTGQVAPVGWGAAAAAALGIISKELLFRYTRRRARELRSELLLANAWHQRSDVGSSVASTIGVVGSALGLPILDPIAALIVGLLIALVGVRIARQALLEVLDTSMEDAMLKALKSEIPEFPGVNGVHNLRARRMGPHILLDLHLEVPGEMSVREAHELSNRIEQRLLTRYSEVSEVLIHIDPERDEL